MKNRQLKKLCKKASRYGPQPFPPHLFWRAWELLKDQYRGFHIMQTGNVWPRPKETPTNVFTWANAHFEQGN